MIDRPHSVPAFAPTPQPPTLPLRYILLSGVNDSEEHARELGALLRGLPGWEAAENENENDENENENENENEAGASDSGGQPEGRGREGQGEEDGEEGEVPLPPSGGEEASAPGRDPSMASTSRAAAAASPRRHWHALRGGPIASVNLIPFNPGPSSSPTAPSGPQAGPAGRPYSAPSPERVHAFQRLLRTSFKLRTSVRVPMGQDIWGACGQLALSLRDQGPPRAGGDVDIEDIISSGEGV